jgi:IS30 family transposase
LTKKLRTGRPLRKRRRSPMARTPRFVVPGRLIHARPAVVEERARIGDREGDLIVGRASRSAIGTLVDRRTGYLRLVHLPDGHSAEQLRVAMLPVLTTAICVRSPRVRRRRPAGMRLRAGRRWQCGP